MKSDKAPVRVPTNKTSPHELRLGTSLSEFSLECAWRTRRRAGRPRARPRAPRAMRKSGCRSVRRLPSQTCSPLPVLPHMHVLLRPRAALLAAASRRALFCVWLARCARSWRKCPLVCGLCRASRCARGWAACAAFFPGNGSPGEAFSCSLRRVPRAKPPGLPRGDCGCRSLFLRPPAHLLREPGARVKARGASGVVCAATHPRTPARAGTVPHWRGTPTRSAFRRALFPLLPLNPPLVPSRSCPLSLRLSPQVLQEEARSRGRKAD